MDQDEKILIVAIAAAVLGGLCLVGYGVLKALYW
jgi:hypothetical protein